MAELGSLTHLRNHGCHDREQRTILGTRSKGLMHLRWHRRMPLSHPGGDACEKDLSPSRRWMRDGMQGPHASRFIGWFDPGALHDGPPFFAGLSMGRSMLRG